MAIGKRCLVLINGEKEYNNFSLTHEKVSKSCIIFWQSVSAEDTMDVKQRIDLCKSVCTVHRVNTAEAC